MTGSRNMILEMSPGRRQVPGKLKFRARSSCSNWSKELMPSASVEFYHFVSITYVNCGKNVQTPAGAEENVETGFVVKSSMQYLVAIVRLAFNLKPVWRKL